MQFFKSLKFKIIMTTILCTAVVSLAGNLFLFNYLNGIINQKADRIDDIYLTNLRTQLDTHMADLTDLGVLCANDQLVVTALEQRSNDSAAMRNALSAQTQLNAYLSSSPLANDVDVMLAINSDGMVIAANTQRPGSVDDRAMVLKQPLYLQISQMPQQPSTLMACTRSIKGDGRRVLAMISPVLGLGSTPRRSYLYVELNLALFESELHPYLEWNDVFLADGSGTLLSSAPQGYPQSFTAKGLEDGGMAQIGQGRYEVVSVPLGYAGLRLYYCVEQTMLDQDGSHIVFTVAVVVLLSLLLAAVLAVVLAAYLTGPISRLNDRLHRIADNDFAFDPSIEKPGGELGQIGRTVNEMTMSIQNLLTQTETMYKQRSEIEIALLQSQVNPHFLYNTLDSIRWMAVIQKNPGIENMTRSLSNLLKNIAKGARDKITIEEELSLLHDYVAIQAVRYMEAFTFVDEVPKELYGYRIVKLTLQPLVENAIFHGIEPTGECGTIKVTGRLDTENGGDILLVVEDDGAGIPPELLANILTSEHTRSHASLNGIGIANVHKRLQLNYGPQYGLTVESELGKFTRITVRIPKEVE